MKRLLPLYLLIGTLLWGVAARAQAPTLKARVSKDGSVGVTLISASTPECSVKRYDATEPVTFSKRSDTEWVPTGDAASLIAPNIFYDSDPSLTCKTATGPHPVVVEVDTIESPVQLPRIDPTYGLPLARWFIDALGTYQACTVGAAAQCSMVENRLQPATGLETGKLEASFRRRDKEVKLTGQIETCLYRLESSFGPLIQGARMNELRINPVTRGCYFGYVSPQRPARLKRDGSEITLTANQDNTYALRLPADAPLGKSEWTLELDDRKAGKVEARIVAAPRRSSDDVRVTYSNPALDRLQDPLSPNGVAIAVPTGAALSSIRNAVRIDLGAELSAASSELVWRVVGTSWGADAALYCQGEEQPRAPSQETPCLLLEPGTIEFSVQRRRREPLQVQLELARAEKAPPTTKQAGEGGTPETDSIVLETSIVLATSAALESIPFPAARVLSIRCCSPSDEGDCQNTELIHSGQTKGIKHSALQDSACHAFLDLTAKNLEKAQIDDPAIYGQQTLVVSVTPQGGASKVAAWEVSPQKNLVANFTLPTPETQAQGGEVYTVEIKVAAGQIAQTQYRAGTTKIEVGEGAGLRRSELVYEARLRSRGVYGIDSAFRVFVTVPVELASVRFPARGDELADSGSSPNYQVVSPIVGVLLGLEPWDYDTGRNRWPLPLRALFGVHSRQVRGHLELSTAAGIAATLPVVDSPDELGSSLALAGYYSVDLAPSNRDFAERQAFILSFGFNVFSLFAGR